MNILHYILYGFLVITIIGLSIALGIIVTEKKKLEGESCPVCPTDSQKRIASKVRNYNFIVYLKSEENKTFFSTLSDCNCASDSNTSIKFDYTDSNVPKIRDNQGNLLVFEHNNNSKTFRFTNDTLNENRKVAEVKFVADLGLTISAKVGNNTYYLTHDDPMPSRFSCPLVLPCKATSIKTILTLVK